MIWQSDSYQPYFGNLSVKIIISKSIVLQIFNIW